MLKATCVLILSSAEVLPQNKCVELERIISRQICNPNFKTYIKF